MAAYNKFNSWVERKNKDVNIATDEFVLFFCAPANAPTSGNSILADLTTIAYTYLDSRVLTTTSATQTGGVLKLIILPLTVTATGGTAAGFRFFGVYDNTPADKPLVCWGDQGATVILAPGQSFVFTPNASMGLYSET